MDISFKLTISLFVMFFSAIVLGEEIKQKEQGFKFGSYGRVQPATDLKGGVPSDTNVVSHGSRLHEKSYVELDFVYLFGVRNNVEFDFVSTLAFSDELFHETGNFNAVNAVRNLFIRAEGIIAKPLTLWAGSRMYRGDDIYLLDFWPLDNVNMYGGGAGWHEDSWRVDFHAGINRLEVDFQHQEIEVPSNDFGTETVTILNRQRLVTGLKAEFHFAGNKNSDFGMKTKLFSELHRIGAGTMIYPDQENREVKYPEDFGYSAGAQLGVYGYGKDDFANLFIKYSGGLAAYGTLSPPYGLNADKKTTGAKDFLTGFSGSWTFWKLGTLFGAYLRYFNDADPNKYDNDDFWEYIITLRPHIMFHEHFYSAFEFSHQMRRPNGLYSDRHIKGIEYTPMVTKLSLIPIVTMGGGVYGRPQIRLVYTVSFQNDDAAYTYHPEDERAEENIHHYVGISAEWWFNVHYR